MYVSPLFSVILHTALRMMRNFLQPHMAHVCCPTVEYLNVECVLRQPLAWSVSTSEPKETPTELSHNRYI